MILWYLVTADSHGYTDEFIGKLKRTEVSPDCGKCSSKRQDVKCLDLSTVLDLYYIGTLNSVNVVLLLSFLN